MKATLLTIALTLSLLTGFSSVSTNAAELSTTTQASTSRIYIKVYENGAIWVYVYEEDGTYVAKYIESSN